jgi:hypothetical protein
MENQNTIVELQAWTATLAESVRRVAFQILEYLPSILGAVVLLLAGWGVARLLRYTTEQLTEKTLVRLAHTRPMDTRIKQPHSYSAAPRIASRIVFWVVMLFFILAAAEVLELRVISGLLSGVTAYLPRLLAQASNRPESLAAWVRYWSCWWCSLSPPDRSASTTPCWSR